MRIDRGLLACGLVAGPLFVTVLFLEGVTRADYDAVRHPGSSLALGDQGWTQITNFIVTGVLMLAFAVGLRRALRPGRGSRWGPPLIGVWGLGLVGAGVFITDPVSGYPPGTPALIERPTTHGTLHDLASLIGFVALVAACLVLARRFNAPGTRGWAVYSVVSALLFAAGIVVSSMAFSQHADLVAHGGLFQRAALVVGFAWTSLVAAHLLADRRRTPP